MTVEDALLAMARTDELHDGTQARAVIVEALHLELLADPESFWDKFFTTLDSFRDDPMRELSERMIRGGKTTFADARAALEKYNAPAKQ